MTFNLKILSAACALLVLGSTGCGPADIGDADSDSAALSVGQSFRIEAEDYQAGGAGVGYSDGSAGNAGGTYRKDDVDLQATTDTGGGYNVGWIDAGEWLAFTAAVPTTGKYSVGVRVSSHVSAVKTLHVEVDGKNVTGPLSFSDASGWQSFRTLTAANISLTAGNHALKVVFETGGLNLNYLDFTLTSVPAPSGIRCPAEMAREVFRDDFNGSALDTGKWNVIQQNRGGGSFTQNTVMLASNVSVSGGALHIAARRHCEDPYVNTSAAAHPAKCSGTNYYSGGWIKAKNAYAGGKGLMIFLGTMPRAIPGSWGGFWARNTDGGAYYGELDLIEQWYDSPKGVASDPNKYSSTTHLGTGAAIQTQSNQVGPFPNLVSMPHVWEVEWDATVTPAVARYYYRDAPGATRVLTKTITSATPGLAGRVSESTFATALKDDWRPYVDFAVSPNDNAWTESADVATTFAPGDVVLDSVITCQP